MTKEEIVVECLRMLKANGSHIVVDILLFSVYSAMPRNMQDSLEQLIDGPVWDGDLISKTERDWLRKHGMSVDVIIKGQSGYNAATDLAYAVWKAGKEADNG